MSLLFSEHNGAPITAVSLCKLKSNNLEDNVGAVFEKEVEAAVNSARVAPSITLEDDTVRVKCLYSKNTGVKSPVSVPQCKIIIIYSPQNTVAY